MDGNCAFGKDARVLAWLLWASPNIKSWWKFMARALKTPGVSSLVVSRRTLAFCESVQKNCCQISSVTRMLIAGRLSKMKLWTSFLSARSPSNTSGSSSSFASAPKGNTASLGSHGEVERASEMEVEASLYAAATSSLFSPAVTVRRYMGIMPRLSARDSSSCAAVSEHCSASLMNTTRTAISSCRTLASKSSANRTSSSGAAAESSPEVSPSPAAGITGACSDRKSSSNLALRSPE
mmetsp:Transcript_19950/g.55448  ORF Transcript_19950/g.55448 Transcript_19950/m.55448 type:complete len:237 (+) Transcript_19950:1252-1962(+)